MSPALYLAHQLFVVLGVGMLSCCTLNTAAQLQPLNQSVSRECTLEIKLFSTCGVAPLLILICQLAANELKNRSAHAGKGYNQLAVLGINPALNMRDALWVYGLGINLVYIGFLARVSAKVDISWNGVFHGVSVCACNVINIAPTSSQLCIYMLFCLGRQVASWWDSWSSGWVSCLWC